MALDDSPQIAAAEAFTGLIVVNGTVQLDWLGWLVIRHNLDGAP